MKPLQSDEGYVVFPPKLSLAIAASVFIGFVTQTAGFAWYASKLDSRVAELEVGDGRILARGDERFKTILSRIEPLERDRDRLVRVEEQVKGVAELLREIRQDIRERR